jgi:hypothetical protein
LQGDRRRVTLVVDAIRALGSDHTAVTAALAAVVLAQRRGWALRVVTREADVDPDAFSALLRRYRVCHRDDVEFEASPPVPSARPLGVTRSDYFIAPANSGAWSVIQTVDPSRLCIVLGTAASVRSMSNLDRQRFAALRRVPGPRILIADASMSAEGLNEVTDPDKGPIIPLSHDFAATAENTDFAALLAPALDRLNWH